MIGYEWVDYEYCATKGIVVTNVPHYATNAVAEKCVMMALALAKKLPLFEQAGKMNWIRNLSVRIYGVSQQILWGLERLVERWRRSWMGS